MITYRFKERVSGHFLFIPPMHGEIISLDRSDLHDVPYVQSSDPLTLVKEAKDVSHV